ncbi:MAG: glycosyltransferase [Bacteroidota bacterium]
MRIFRKLQQVARVKFGIIWSFDNSVFYDFDSLPNRLFKISHSMDLSQSFQMARSSRSADVCFGVTPEIVERQRKRNKHSYLITHGVTLHLPIEKIILPGTNKKKVLYFGNLAMPHLNWDLLKKATERFLAVDFILVGSNHAFAHKIHTRNLHLVNSVSSKCLPGYMAACDVLILFYKKQYHNSYAMPHKMLEYLSSGKPIVSNEFSGYKEMTDLIYQADTQVEWIQNLERALDKDDPRKSEQRKSFALANTYKTKLHEIQQIIQEL